MMKKLFPLLLSFLLASMLIACNVDGTETTDPDDTIVETVDETEPETEPETEAPETEPPVGTYLVDSKYHTDAYIVANYNVLNYGAVGDGVTDDTAAIQAAIEDAKANGGGTVFFPEGHYCVYEPLVLDIGIMLVGELEEGTANGTVIHVYCGKNDPEGTPFISMHHTTAVQNMAFYYPEQELVDGKPIPYPYTMALNLSSETVSIQNVTLVNSYNGIDFSDWINMLQTVRSVYGTVLNIGIIQDESYDITRFEDIHFSPDYWLNCGLGEAPDEAELRDYMLHNSIGIIVGKIDWTYITDIYIDGYLTGFSSRELGHLTAHGQLYNLQFTNCYNPLVIEDMDPYGYIIANSTFEAVGDENATAVVLSKNFNNTISFIDCTISSEGKYAITNEGVGLVTAIDTTITAAEKSHYSETGEISFINSEIEGDEVITAELPDLRTDMAYNLRKDTKPASATFINMGEEPYNIKDGEDITERLQAAIDSLKETGGMVYLPRGFYSVQDAITVHSGIEIRGQLDMSSDMLNKFAVIETDFGKNDPDGEALFNLKANSGLRGLAFAYPNQMADGVVTPYSYTVRGDGENIYLCNLLFTSSYNGVDFATNRCDNHYVDYFRGSVLNVGVYAGGGSENGLVRNIQYNTPNIYNLVFAPRYGGNGAFDYLQANGTPFKIGETKNQIFYHNFTFGGRKGIHILDGAENAYLLANGVDAGGYSLYIEGNCTAQLVNTQLVNRDASDPHHIVIDESFTGNVEILNTATWGTTGRSSVVVDGSGKVTFMGGQLNNSNFILFELNGGDTVVAGIHEFVAVSGRDLSIDPDVSSVTLVGNVFYGGLSYRARGVDEAKLIGFEK